MIRPTAPQPCAREAALSSAARQERAGELLARAERRHFGRPGSRAAEQRSSPLSPLDSQVNGRLSGLRSGLEPATRRLTVGASERRLRLAIGCK